VTLSIDLELTFEFYLIYLSIVYSLHVWQPKTY